MRRALDLLDEMLHAEAAERTTRALQRQQLVDFFLSEEVQTIFANVGYPPVIGGLEGKVNPEARPLIQAKLLGTTDPKLQDDMLKLAKQIYK